MRGYMRKGTLSGTLCRWLLSDNKNVLRRSAGALNLGNLGIRQVTPNEDERRCDIVKVEIAQVGYILAAAEYTERSLEIDPREQNKRHLIALRHISETEAGENVVEAESSKIANRHSTASEQNSAARKIDAGPKGKTYIAVCQIYHSFS